MEKERQQKMVYKILLIGDSGTGKTNILARSCENTFIAEHVSTIGIDFKLWRSPARDFKLQLWETTGGERFRQIITPYYRTSDMIVIVYDITNRDSFSHVKYWYDSVAEHGEFSILLVGNKSDLQQLRKVSIAEAEDLAFSMKAMHMEYSAKESSPEEFINKVLEMVDKIRLNEGE